jgi:hypothetical protein
MRTILFRMGIALTAVLLLGVMPVSAHLIVSETFDTAPDPAKWTLSGNAIWDPATQAIILTGPQLIQAGSIFWSEQLSAEAFAASFDLWIGGGSGADGMTFAWVNGPDLLGQLGGGLGFYGLDGYGVKFDTFSLVRGEPENYMAIVEGNQDPLSGGFASNDTIHEMEDTVNAGGDPAPFRVEIVFDSGHLETWMSNPTATSPMPRTKVLDAFIPGYAPSGAFFGFTAATALLTNYHAIDNVVIEIMEKPGPTEFAVVDVHPTPGGVSLTWEDLGPESLYTVEYCDSLGEGLWIPCSPVVQWPTASVSWRIDEVDVADLSRRFYRVTNKAPGLRDEVLGIAAEFAGLTRATGVTKPRVGFSHTNTVNVMGNDGRGDVLIGVDPETGEVIKMVKQCPYPGIDSENVVISADNAVDRALGFLAERGLPPIPQDFVLQDPRLRTTWRKKHWEVTWQHYVGEVQVLTDFITFLVNPEEGSIDLYSKVRHNVLVSADPTVNSREALLQARAALGTGSLADYDPNMSLLDTKLKILYPNHYFVDFIWHWTDYQALAYVFQFGDGGKPAIDIWIDGHSGDLLGGEIYERPVPDLWAVPDQLTDITSIWEPALDIMRYNSNQTHLGNTTDTNVINSISTGEYFILQTHGGATATAETADLIQNASTDQGQLDPSEVPANNLRYALVSCCESGRDGTGTDFREAFINQGADVFQGYVESMNPDPYEQSLVHYLAEGQSLWNAHKNAVADVKPWFTIVIEYGPPLHCYNQLLLAPLWVIMTAPGSVSNTATIKATVINLESARKTTATNVEAQLQMPPGFTITSGPNPQKKSGLPWLQPWTAQWTVAAPAGTSGTRTFDVIVRSDNLGVAVTDFNKPFHKVNIKFSP